MIFLLLLKLFSVRAILSVVLLFPLIHLFTLESFAQSNKERMCDAILNEAEKSAETYQLLIRRGDTSGAEYYKKKGQKAMADVQRLGC